MTSKITSVFAVGLAPTKVALSLPPVPRPIVTELAWLSPLGKLIVDVVGLLVGASVSET